MNLVSCRPLSWFTFKPRPSAIKGDRVKLFRSHFEPRASEPEECLDYIKNFANRKP